LWGKKKTAHLFRERNDRPKSAGQIKLGNGAKAQWRQIRKSHQKRKHPINSVVRRCWAGK